MISPTRHNPTERTQPMKENVSCDRHKEETYLELSRSGNRDLEIAIAEGLIQAKDSTRN